MDASIHSAADPFVGARCGGNINTADEDDALRVVVAVEVGKICVDNQPTALARIFKALFVLLLFCCDRDLDHYRYCPHCHCHHYSANKDAQADDPPMRRCDLQQIGQFIRQFGGIGRSVDGPTMLMYSLPR